MMTTEELEQTLGRGVRALRVSRRLTQVEVAERANVSLGALKHLEHGAGATTTTLVKVLRALEAEGWLETLAPPPQPFDPMKLLEERERRGRATGPSRVRRPKQAEA
jgi:transcriptional regulator with XRE-family HTH domain